MDTGNLLALPLRSNFSNFGNGSSVLSKLYFPEIIYPGMVLLLFGTTFGTCGNILVICTVAMWKPLRIMGNSFVVNLAVADLLITVLIDPFGIIGLLEGESYFLSRPALCTMIGSLCLVSCFCSLLSLCSIAINRYICICHFRLYPKIYSRFNTALMITALWVASCLMELHNFLGMDGHIFDRKNLACLFNRMANRIYSTMLINLGVGIPCCIIAACYAAIFLYVRKRTKQIAETTSTSTASSSGSGSVKLAKTLFLVFACLVACWSPYALLVLMDSSDFMPVHAHAFAILLAHLNSALNVLVYGATNREFRRGYRHVLRRMLGPMMRCWRQVTNGSGSSGGGHQQVRNTVTQTTEMNLQESVMV